MSPEFALTRVEAVGDDRLEVEGTWSGVRCVRFVRPALVVHGAGGEPAAERTLLATLDHKPWPAEDGRPWTAASSSATAEARVRRVATDEDRRLAAAREEIARAEQRLALAREERDEARAEALEARDRLAAERERERGEARVAEVRQRLADAEDERDRALSQPAGVAVPVPVQRVAREHEAESTRADWAARIAAILALLVLLVLFITFIRALG